MLQVQLTSFVSKTLFVPRFREAHFSRIGKPFRWAMKIRPKTVRAIRLFEIGPLG